MSSCSDDSRKDSKITTCGSSSGCADTVDDLAPDTSTGMGRRPWPPTRSLSNPPEGYEQPNTGELHQDTRIPRPRLQHRFYSANPFEPHLLDVQPVKDLVVKKLKSFRQRFRGSLHSLPSDITSGDRDPGSPASDSARSETSSHKIGSDGKERRRLARQRGDILSSSTESTPYYNSSVGVPSPDASCIPSPPVKPASFSPRYERSEDLGTSRAAGAIDPFSDRLYSTQDSECPSLLRLDSQLSAPSAPVGNGENTSDIESRISSPTRAKSATASTTPRTKRRNNRKSLLSEVYTFEDFEETTSPSLTCLVPEYDREAVDRSVLSTIGSALATPTTEKPGGLCVNPLTEATFKDEEQQPRPLTRMNTTGTQRFILDAEGLEVEGLPVGPGKEAWDAPEEGKRREKSFL